MGKKTADCANQKRTSKVLKLHLITSSQRKSDNSNNNGPRRNEVEDSMRHTTNARQCLDVGEGMLKLFYRFGGQDWPIYQVSSKSIQTQKLT